MTQDTQPLSADEIAKGLTGTWKGQVGVEYVALLAPHQTYRWNGTKLLPDALWSDSTGTALVKPDGTTTSLSGAGGTEDTPQTLTLSDGSEYSLPFAWAHVNDGSDQTAGIQSALDTGEPAVFIPKGDRLITQTLTLREYQTIYGVPVPNTNPHDSNQYSNIRYAPSGADLVAIKNEALKNGCCIENLAIQVENAAHTAVQIYQSYGNKIRNVIITGTMDIGILVDDAYVLDISNVEMSGLTVKTACVFIGRTTTTVISHLHTESVAVQNDSLCMYGLAIKGEATHVTINDPVLQGPTIGIALDAGVGIIVNNPYFENVVACMRVGTSDFQGPAALTITGGIIGPPTAFHSQYASRSYGIWMRGGYQSTIRSMSIGEEATPGASTGFWPILLGNCRLLTVDTCFYVPGAHGIRDAIVMLGSPTAVGLTVIGSYSDWDTNATEIILKKSGAYGVTCYRIAVDVTGAITSTAWAPTAVTGTPAALLSTDLPSALSLVK